MNRIFALLLMVVLPGCAYSMRYPWDRQQDRHEVKPTPTPAPTAYPTPPPAATPTPAWEPPPKPTRPPEQIVAPRALDCVVMFPTGDAKAIPCPVTPTPTPEVLQ